MNTTQTQEEEIQLNNDKKLVFYARRDVFHHHQDNRELKIELEISKNLAFRRLSISYGEGASYVNSYYDIDISAYFDYSRNEIFYKSRDASSSSPPSSGEIELKISERTDNEPPFIWEEEYLQSEEYYEKWKNNNISVEDAKKILSEIIDYFLPTDDDENAIISLSGIAKMIQDALDASYDYIDVRVEDL
mgnify:CR=1 FL=1